MEDVELPFIFDVILHVSRSSAATHLRCDWQHYIIRFVANFMLFLAVKSYEDRLSFGQLQQVKPGKFFGTQTVL